MIDLHGIDHICLLVSDLEKSQRYYEKFFNVVCKPHPTDTSTLMVESPYIHFFIKEINSPQTFLEYQHLSFKVPTLDHIIRELRTNNIGHKVGMFTHFKYSNYRWVEWRDPDGIRLECIELLKSS
jgi:catechol 2,3-dioxygenase-like lactoylglutathione lyase family enzyme